MWILLLVIFGTVTTDDVTAFIEKYTLETDCNDAKDYISTEMSKAYANDNQRFELKCVFHGAKL